MNSLYSAQSRGKQYSLMSLSALLNAQNIPVIEWNTATANNRQSHYVPNAFENGDIAHERFLSMNDLPSVVRWSEDESNSLSIEGIDTCRSVIDTTSPVEANDYS